MYFNSVEFLIFFLVVVGLYWLLSHRAQNRFLLIASYIFYGAWDWRFLSLILVSTIVDYIVGNKIHATESHNARRQLLVISVLVNLGILGIFKYFNFFVGSFQGLFGAFGVDLNTFNLNIILPVGISFYTFQTMSYTIDIYRKKLTPSHNILDFALFVAFFPQLVAGPIERAVNLVPQIQKSRRFRLDHFASGLYLMLWGLFKKVVIADNLAMTVDQVFAKESGFYQGEVLVGVLFFAFQIYCDFSGYSDIARGVARTLGFELMVNFNLPYFAQNPSDFWQRWHISLSSWLRDYLYIPLGGNRGSETKTYRNLTLTMLLGGLWHGAAWNFLVWGFYHGVGLSVHRKFTEQRNRRVTTGAGLPPWYQRGLNIVVMFCFTLYGWLLFRAEGFTQIANMTRDLIPTGLDPRFLANLLKLLAYVFVLVLVQAAQYRARDLEIILKKPVLVQAGFYTVCYYLLVVMGAFNGPSFIYFQF